MLSVQRSCVSLCRASANVSLDQIHELAERGLRENLSSLGFDASGKVRQLLGQAPIANPKSSGMERNGLTPLQKLEALFPHHVGHFIGLDVHDTPGFSRREPLKERQCVTIEP